MSNTENVQKSDRSLISRYLSHEELNLLTPVDLLFLSANVDNENFNDINHIWALMDREWDKLNLSNQFSDENIRAFYNSPVWLLNGIFVENDFQSTLNRKRFCAEIVKNKPKRIADFGGGFGTLSRLIAKELPNSTIEIIEPFPAAIALHKAENHSNLSYQKQLTGEYDCVILTDVLEHIENPLDVVYSISNHLSNKNGLLLVANCFYPVIKCHLPVTFHYRYSFDFIMLKMGFMLDSTVSYGKVWRKVDSIRVPPLGLLNKSKYLFKLTKFLPARIGNILTRIIL
jgi:2-polyprenyl-6-hydroxyphenyl methylase/3-demethylubiquinone-9 3-methyltransferase